VTNILQKSYSAYLPADMTAEEPQNVNSVLFFMRLGGIGLNNLIVII